MAGNIVRDNAEPARDKTLDKGDRKENEATSKLFLNSADPISGRQRRDESASDSRKLERENKLGQISLTDTAGKDPLKLSLPETISAKAHPKKGEGYYQPLDAAGTALLGKELSSGEIKALVSGARAMRKEQGKSLYDLSKQDLLLPSNTAELKTFVENIGNNKFGKQTLDKEGIEKLKDGITKKLNTQETKEEGKKEQNKEENKEPNKEPNKEANKDPIKEPNKEPNKDANGTNRTIEFSDPYSYTGERADQTKSPTKEKPEIAIEQTQQKETKEKAEQKSSDASKSFDAIKAQDATATFADVQAGQAAKLLNNEANKQIPPIAEAFEQNALKQLGPEQKANIFVSKDANDKNIPAGATSYRSINEAIKNAKAGAVIQVLPGEYNETIKFNGEAQSNITVQTDRQNPAVLNGGSFQIGSNSHDISIRNFDIKNFSGKDSAIRIDGSNIRDITIAGNNVHDANNAEGIAVYGRPGEPVSRISIVANRVHDLKLGTLEAMPINGNVDGFKIVGNSGYHLNNLFIDAIGGEGIGGNKDQARNGLIANNFADGISSKHNSKYGDYSAAAIYSDGAKSLNISGNYVRNSDFGVEIGSEHSKLNSSDVHVQNNIIENSVTWLKLGYKGGVDNSDAKNNLIIKNKLSDVEREGPVAKSVVVDANIQAADRNSITKIPGAIANEAGSLTTGPSQNKPELPVDNKGSDTNKGEKEAAKKVEEAKTSVDAISEHDKELAKQKAEAADVDVTPDAKDLKALQLAGKLIKDAEKLESAAKKDLQVAKYDRSVADQNYKLAQQTFLGIGSQPYLDAAQKAVELAERREKHAETKLKEAQANRDKSAQHSQEVLQKALDKMIGAQFWRAAPAATQHGNLGCAIAVTKALKAMGADIKTELAVTNTAHQMKEMGWKQVSLSQAMKSGQLFVAVNKETGSHIGLGIGQQVWENNSAQRRFISRKMNESTLRHSGRAYIVSLK